MILYRGLGKQIYSSLEYEYRRRERKKNWYRIQGGHVWEGVKRWGRDVVIVIVVAKISGRIGAHRRMLLAGGERKPLVAMMDAWQERERFYPAGSYSK